MNRRADRLAPVVEMALKAEREAARQLGLAQNQLLQAQRKLAELERFRADYQQQWIDRGRQGVSGQWLLDYQRFLAQLETAVEQQNRSLAWHQDVVEKARVTWSEKYARLEGLRKLVERYREEARLLADKQEQKQLDEFAQRLRPPVY
ncbi:MULTISPECIES: flagellar export protein FliJ [unclassified Pseudomonas]|uniref:flagellar export protein FliJ n=1 Tax=unclassified Pseudomonas TaxID=196821 RepID=UPI0002A33C20|nr:MULTISPECIES: flagellar export protein FliJ [unclassified Pseudomonas]MBB1607091.1 flagellar protein FliJ [Pseudomonas sp. UMC76]MBB1642175.1 flagellar protein FliJ [Pseudomonas sp. UME83]NTX87893.1 flagella biosynthesis chaperone FliJ [Pseudomonas sp. UMA643]NTY18397.1 flagella biosynthesis chaperone FliJ [Pseudomonas sp. UMC3103]NTY26186.1 flagella biosynthesis chaperone FliJ [Pseudomonas sp. UMA603]